MKHQIGGRSLISWLFLLLACLALVGAGGLLLSGCGSSGPEYQQVVNEVNQKYGAHMKVWRSRSAFDKVAACPRCGINLPQNSGCIGTDDKVAAPRGCLRNQNSRLFLQTALDTALKSLGILKGLPAFFVLPDEKSLSFSARLGLSTASC